jgi:thymidylate synthase
MLYFNNFSDCYLKTLKLLNEVETSTSPRGIKTKEIISYSYTLKDVSEIISFSSRKILKYLSGEFAWYYLGDNEVEKILPFSNFWKKIANSDGTVNSNYGYSLFKQGEWKWCVNSLKNDKDTRQSIFLLNKPEHKFENNKDFPCTLNGQFLIRNNKLNLIVNQRSCDIVKGMTYDVPFFQSLIFTMKMEIQKEYPEVEIGTFTHNINSLHLYDSDKELVEKMLSEEPIKFNLKEWVEYPIFNENWYSILNMEKECNSEDENIQFLHSNIR